LLSAGMMGGFTTFSTFSLQTLTLMQNGNWGLAFLNAIASVVCCLLSVWAGWRLGQWAFR
jgi:CrcB protein